MALHVMVYAGLLLLAASQALSLWVKPDNLESLIQKELVKRDLAAEVRLGEANLDFAPWPCLSLERVTVLFPEKGFARIKRLLVAPDLVSILSGEPRLGSLTLLQPQIILRHAQKDDSRDPSSETDLQTLVDKAPAVEVYVRDGELELYGSRILVLREIRADADTTAGLSFSLNAQSNFGRDLGLTLESGGQRKGLKGTAKARELKLERLAPYLPPETSKWVSSSRVEVGADFRLPEPGSFQAKLRLRSSRITLKSATGAHTFRVESGEGSISSGEHGERIRVENMQFDSPRMGIQGELTLDPRDSGMGVDLDARDVSVPSLASACTSLFPGEEAFRNVFGLLTNGTLSSMSLTASVDNPEELTSSLRMEGSLEQGTVQVPSPEIALSEVSGDFSYADKRLDLDNLAASYRKSRIHGGGLQWRFLPGEDSFQSHISYKLQLADIKRILSRNPGFPQIKRQLEQIRRLQGKAKGSLSLSKKRDRDYKWFADLKQLDLEAQHSRLPFPVALSGQDISSSGKNLRMQDLKAELGSSSVRKLSGRVGLSPPFRVKLTGEDIHLDSGEINSWLGSAIESPMQELDLLQKIQGGANWEQVSLSGTLLQPQQMDFLATGGSLDMELKLRPMPDTLRISAKDMRIDPREASVSDLRIQGPESELDLQGKTTYDSQGISSFQCLASGGVRSDQLLDIAYRIMEVPERLKLRAPVSMQECKAQWDRDDGISLNSRFSLAHGISGDIRLSLRDAFFKLHRLRIGEGDRSFVLRTKRVDSRLEAAFQGKASLGELAKALRNPPKLRGVLEGDFRASLTTAPWHFLESEGTLRVDSLRLPPYPGLPDWELSQARILGTAEVMNLKRFRILLAGKPLQLTGSIDITDKVNLVDLDLQARDLDLAWLRELIPSGDSGGEEGVKLSAIKGEVGIGIDSFQAGEFSFSPVQGELKLKKEGADLLINRAELCHLLLRGEVGLSGNATSMSFSADAAEKDLEEMTSCLGGGDLISGTFSLAANTEAEGELDLSLLEKNQGEFEFTSREGSIKRFTLLSRVFALLNTTEIIFGKLPDLQQKGLEYNTIEARGTIQGQTLQLEEALIDGKSMKLGLQGSVDLLEQEMDLILLVSPLKTVDRILSWIPLVGYILDDTLVTIPLQVRGDVRDPTVIPLSPKAVGSEVYGIMKRTLSLPFKILQPLVPEGKEEKPEQGQKRQEYESPQELIEP